MSEITPVPPIPPWPGELVKLNEGEIFVRTAPPSPGGAAEPAVFVHGFASTAVDWTDLMAELRDVVAGDAVDLPGYGFSPPPPRGDYSLTAHARAVADLIDTCGRGPVHLFGNSLGGMISIRIAARRPDLVRTLTLIAPALPDSRAYLRAAALALPALPLVSDRISGPLLRRVPAERRVEIRYQHDFHDLARVHPDRWAEAVAEERRHDALPHANEQFFGTLRGALRTWLQRGEGSLWRDLDKITAPTLLLWGRHDQMVDPRLAVPAGRRIAGSRVALLPECGHIPQLERPQETAREFRALLADRARARGDQA